MDDRSDKAGRATPVTMQTWMLQTQDAGDVTLAVQSLPVQPDR